MIAKSLTVAAALAVSLAAALPSTPAQAKTNIDIDLHLGGGYPVYPGGGGYYPVYDDDSYGGISCHQGKKVVRWNGYKNVHPVDCSLPGYRYTGWKWGKKFMIRVNAHGNITKVKQLTW
jgi:hypothetical protein